MYVEYVNLGAKVASALFKYLVFFATPFPVVLLNHIQHFFKKNDNLRTLAKTTSMLLEHESAGFFRSEKSCQDVKWGRAQYFHCFFCAPQDACFIADQCRRCLYWWQRVIPLSLVQAFLSLCSDQFHSRGLGQPGLKTNLNGHDSTLVPAQCTVHRNHSLCRLT